MALDDYKTALVTGTSSGIGAAVVAALSSRGLAVTAVARRENRLEALAQETGCTPLVFDLRDTAALYDASKGAIHLLSQNLRVELQGSGVRVTEICPGRVETEFFQVAVGEEAAKEAYAGFEILRPQDVADAILYALDTPWRVNVSTIEMTPTEQYAGGVTIVPVEKG